MRDIKYIVFHCTATSQDAKVESILNYWRNVLGWRNPGYHFLIDKHGGIHDLLDVDRIANGVKGYNQNSIHISYIGGIDENGHATDNRTMYQKWAQLGLLESLLIDYPDAEVKGHRDFPNVRKDCPSFDVQEWLISIGYLE